jgi:hypothetical protein
LDTYDSGQVYSNDIGDVDVVDVLTTVQFLGTRSKRLPMSRLFHNLQQPVWGERIGTPFELTKKVNEGSSLSNDEFHHWERVMNSDLRYPIIAYTSGDRLFVIDGMHRLTKAFNTKKTTLKVFIIKEADLDDLMRK